MIETEMKIRVNEGEFNGLYQTLGMPEFLLQRNWCFFIPEGYVRVRDEGTKKYITLKKKIETQEPTEELIDEFEKIVSELNFLRSKPVSVKISCGNQQTPRCASSQISFNILVICNPCPKDTDRVNNSSLCTAISEE